MIVRDSDEHHDPQQIPTGLPAEASLRRLALPCGKELLLLVVPHDHHDERQSPSSTMPVVDAVNAWVAAAGLPATNVAAVVSVPLYGCHVTWAPGRAAVIGSPSKLDMLVTAVADFAGREAELRQLEERCGQFLEALDGDAPYAFAVDERGLDHHEALAARFREAVAVRGRLALLAPAVHAPPLHPPTLASQLGERLRDRTRLAERHEFAVDRAELAERLYEACGQRIAEFGIARRQLGLEWAIVVLLVIQTALLIVDLLTRGTAP